MLPAGVGAGLGVLANRYARHRQIQDADYGQLYRMPSTRMRVAARRIQARHRGRAARGRFPAHAQSMQGRPRIPRRGGGKVYRKGKTQNGGHKTTMHKPKRKTHKFSKPIQKNVLYPNTAKIITHLGDIRHFSGSSGASTTATTQLGNSLFRLAHRSKDYSHSSWEVVRLTALAKTNDATGTPETQLSVGTNYFASSAVEADILSTEQSRILTNAGDSSSAVETLSHYSSCTGTPRFDINPNHLVCGVAIDLEFLSARQIKQRLNVKIVRIKSQALEDRWGQSKAGATALSFDLFAQMVNSQRHIDPNEFEVLFDHTSMLPQLSTTGAPPKVTRVKKYLPLSYTMTQAKKTYSGNSGDYGAQLKPVQQRDNSYYNQLYLVYSVIPVQTLVFGTRTDQTAPNAAGASVDVVDSFTEGTEPSNTPGFNTSARFRVRGRASTYIRAQAMRRMNTPA